MTHTEEILNCDDNRLFETQICSMAISPSYRSEDHRLSVQQAMNALPPFQRDLWNRATKKGEISFFFKKTGDWEFRI